MSKPEIVEDDLVMTCSACPSQWESNESLEKPYVYIRFRHGNWSIRIDEQCVASGSSDNGSDGVCSLEDIKRWSKGQVNFI